MDLKKFNELNDEDKLTAKYSLIKRFNIDELADLTIDILNEHSNEEKLEQAQKTEKTIRLAKRALQQNQNMTEDEAHRYIQKRSMELRISKLELAERILKSYKKNS